MYNMNYDMKYSTELLFKTNLAQSCFSFIHSFIQFDEHFKSLHHTTLYLTIFNTVLIEKNEEMR